MCTAQQCDEYVENSQRLWADNVDCSLIFFLLLFSSSDLRCYYYCFETDSMNTYSICTSELIHHKDYIPVLLPPCKPVYFLLYSIILFGFQCFMWWYWWDISSRFDIMFMKMKRFISIWSCMSTCPWYRPKTNNKSGIEGFLKNQQYIFQVLYLIFCQNLVEVPFGPAAIDQARGPPENSRGHIYQKLFFMTCSALISLSHIPFYIK